MLLRRVAHAWPSASGRGSRADLMVAPDNGRFLERLANSVAGENVAVTLRCRSSEEARM